jgi:hypothetical protein
MQTSADIPQSREIALKHESRKPVIPTVRPVSPDSHPGITWVNLYLNLEEFTPAHRNPVDKNYYVKTGSLNVFTFDPATGSFTMKTYRGGSEFTIPAEAVHFLGVETGRICYFSMFRLGSLSENTAVWEVAAEQAETQKQWW